MKIFYKMMIKPMNKNSYKNLAETSLKLITKINFFPQKKFIYSLINYFIYKVSPKSVILVI